MATAHRAPSDAGPGRTAGYGDGPRNPFSAFLLAPLENRTYREFLYLLTGFPLAIVTFSWTVTMVSVSAGLLITFVGIPLLALTLASCRGIGAFERARARGLLHLDAPDPEPVSAVQRSSGLMAWVGALLRSGTSWRHLLYTVVYFPWATAAFTVSFVFWATGWALLLSPAYHWVFDAYTDQPGPEFGDWGYLDSAPELAVASLAGLVLVLLTPWLIRGLAQVDRLLVLGLLGPSRLAERAQELESDRGAVVDTAAADLRRIERDLHDGAQARLVSLAMELGLAKEKLLEDPHAAAHMVDEAHGEVKIALQELRDLARGIHPAILTDRGLGPALTTLTTRCTTPTTLTTDLTDRPAPAIEGIAYFTASELLQNITKHSHAHHAEIDLWRTEDRLMLQVWDNGVGGATAGPGSGGTGLAGLAERLDSVDGLLLIDSPAGGPTTITAELPWHT